MRDGVLLRNALARVDHDETHVRALNGKLRAHDGKLLDAIVHLGLAAEMCIRDRTLRLWSCSMQGLYGRTPA